MADATEHREGFVTIGKVAKHFDVHEQTIRTWMREGRIPKHAYLKVGKSLRFRISDVESALLSPREDDADESGHDENAPVQLELDFTTDGE